MAHLNNHQKNLYFLCKDMVGIPPILKHTEPSGFLAVALESSCVSTDTGLRPDNQIMEAFGKRNQGKNESFQNL